MMRAIALAVAAASMAQGQTAKPAAADARAFLDKTEERLLALSTENQRMTWVQSTYVTDDTDLLAALANERMIAATVEHAKQATRFDGPALPADLARKLHLLKTALTLATPSDPKQATELTQIVARMEGAYGRGKYCASSNAPDVKSGIAEESCLDLQDITKIMAGTFEPERLLDVWRGWHTVGAGMRTDFVRYVELGNKGARELGFKDMGAMWRSKYDMPAEAFAAELDRLWTQVRPLYVSLHAYVRNKLREKYGDKVMQAKGPIPAHLLGNMWAQEWSNIYSLVAPPNADPGYDLTKILKARRTGPLDMIRYGERFFTSLGFDPLPKSFWDRSLFTKPRDREVVCHASAWDVDNIEDLRIKMCIDITDEDFNTIHHELGHNFYQRAYNRQPFLFRDSANDGFHEAIGDVIALSVTPEYLVKIGLLDKAPDASRDIGLLLRRALDGVAFLPFGLLIDQWRWKVFSGETPPGKYNQSWWDLRLKYQGVAPAVPRTEGDFDPAAKYHVAANTPYARYFLARILQFQFHRGLSRLAGCKEPLHRCSIYGSGPAGQRLKTMLAMGASRPWPEALKALTGETRMDAGAIIEYFAPLRKWLDEQNKGKPVDW
ncbi:MAG TPA: M2 family metallopeptidase [Bryobacteraceae bacterium]|nr:M2 family metallopeptidase [Bryobacteraceae bacterium]